MKRAHSRIPAPRENQLPRASHPDHLVIYEVWRHANQREVFSSLADDLMTRCKRNQMSETLHRQNVAILHHVSDGVPQR
jgi:hypothetical protein